MKAKRFDTYLAALPEKKLTLILQIPTASVKDFAEGDFETDLLAIGAKVNGLVYIGAFETTPEVKRAILEVQSGHAVQVTLLADDDDADNFPSVVLG